MSTENRLQIQAVFNFDGEIVKQPWAELKTRELIRLGSGVDSEDLDLRDFCRTTIGAVVQEMHDDKLELYLVRLELDEMREIQRVRHQKQSAGGRKGGEKRSLEPVVREMIAALAARTDQLGGNLAARELWPEFSSMLDEAGLNPKDDCRPAIDDSSWIKWDGHPNAMTFHTFENKLIVARGSVKK